MKLKQEGYGLSDIPVIEVIGSILIFATIFLPWMRVNLGLGVSECLRFSDKTIYIIVFGVACFANVALKFFRRSTWASLPITLCGIELLVWVSRFYFRVLSMKEESGEITMMESMIGKKILTLDIGYYLALFTSVVMLICIIRGWLTYLHNKAMRMPYESYKKQQTIALISLLATVALAYLTKEIVVDIDCTVDSGWEAYDVIIKNIEALIPVILAHITAFLFSHYLLLAMMILDKHKDGKNVTEDNITENEGISDVQHQTEEKTVETPVSPAHVEESQEEMSDIEQDDNDEVDDNRKKWYYIGGAVAAAVIAVSCFFAFSGGSGNGNNPLGVQKPKWEKFIKVNTSDVKLYKEADVSSSYVQLAIERLDGCMPNECLVWSGDKAPRGYDVSDYNVETNTVFPVLDESDEWYRVHIGIGTNREAYIQKIHCEEVKPEPITKEVIAKVYGSDNGAYKFVEKGEFANLLILREAGDVVNAESVMLGVLTDGCIVAPNECLCFPQMKDTTGVAIRNVSDTPDSKFWHLTCPDSYWNDTQDEECPKALDVNKLTDSDIQKIVLAMRPQGNTASKVYYYFPTVATDRFIEFEYSFSPAATVVVEGQTVVTDFRVEGEKLIATIDGEDREVDLDFGNIKLFGVKDLDGDGSMEAVISHFMTSINGEPVDCPLVVYYDAENDKLKQTDEMKLTYESEPTFEGSDGSIIMVQHEGLKTIRYAFEDKKLVVKKEEFKNYGTVNGTIKLEDLFTFGEDAEKSITADFFTDDDGSVATLTFSYEGNGYYHGLKMQLYKYEFDDGRDLRSTIDAETFKILKEHTNGMPDIIGDNYLYRWNGSNYESYGWDGNNLVREDL